jgi:hypothetical protein
MKKTEYLFPHNKRRDLEQIVLRLEEQGRHVPREICVLRPILRGLRPAELSPGLVRNRLDALWKRLLFLCGELEKAYFVLERKEPAVSLL